MTDRVYPSSKSTPTTNPPLNGTTTAAAAAATNAAPKPYIPPPTQHPYRPQPYNNNNRQNNNHQRRHSSRGSRCSCCCCIFWSILILLFLALIACIAGAAFWVLYHPHRPSFTVSTLKISTLNLTTTADSSSTHLTTSFNLTLSSQNPNSKITFFYDPFTATLLSAKSSVAIANGTFPAFTSNANNFTAMKFKLSTSQQDLDADSVTKLRSDLKTKKNKKNGLPLELKLDTKVTVNIGKLKSEKIGIRVTCDGIRGVVPNGKSPSVASTSGAKCKVDLRIKIWKFTF